MRETRRRVARFVARAAAAFDRRDRQLRAGDRILVCAIGGIGNTILLLPLLRTLRARLPGANVDLLLSNRAAADLAAGMRFADEILCVPEREWFDGLRPLRMFGGRIRSRGYDVLLRTFITTPSMSRASLAAFLSGARLRVAYGHPAANPFETHLLDLDPGRSEIDRHLDLARALGIEPIADWGGLEVPREARIWARDFLTAQGWDGMEPIVGIHPGSDTYYLAKRWPAERFGLLASVIAKRGARPMVLGGPGDEDALARFAASCGPGVIAPWGQDIVRSSALVERCAAFVSNDSGLMHLASALQVPTLALFGPTDPVKNRSLGRRTAVVRLSLPCSPCDHEVATFQCAHHDCLETLTVERVLRDLDALVDRQEHPGEAGVAGASSKGEAWAG